MLLSADITCITLPEQRRSRRAGLKIGESTSARMLGKRGKGGFTMPGLEGVHVLELGQMVSAAYATKLMADMGADVIKVEEPAGDSARRRGPFPNGERHAEKSGLFLAL